MLLMREKKQISTYCGKICFGDTDAGGVVYYAQYLYFLEAARMKLLQDINFPHHQLISKFGLGFVVSDVEIHYKKSLKVEDEFKIELSLGEIGRVFFEVNHVIYNQNLVVNSGKVKLVCVDWQSGKPSSLPEIFLEAIKTSQNK